MKKLMLVGAVAVLGLSACKKDYTCKCDLDGFSYEYTMTETKKAAAAAVCEGEGIGGIEVDGESVEQEDTGCSLQ